jgi:hypothetical protein
MKTRLLSFFTIAAGYAFLTSASVMSGAGCSSGGGSATPGTGGTTGGPTISPENKISDFEDLAAAVVVQAGTPPRNGYWYTYNDWSATGADAATCMQSPKTKPYTDGNGLPAETYVGSAPPTASPNGGGLALHAVWSGCSVWGAGIGADFNQPVVPDGGTYTGKKVKYDVSAFTGVTFWAAASAGSDTALRIKLPMTDETKVEDGGDCVESATNKCSDDWGYKFNLPTNGTWKQITVRWTDPAFIQEGWGAIFPWTKTNVTSVQIQSQNAGEPYDFWVDDMYFITD